MCEELGFKPHPMGTYSWPLPNQLSKQKSIKIQGKKQVNNRIKERHKWVNKMEQS